MSNQLFHNVAAFTTRKITLSTTSLILWVSVLIIVLRMVTLPQQLLTWDVFGYYLYLPARFIHHDLFLQNQEWLTQLIADYQPTGTLYQAVQTESGNWVMKYPMGMAILFAPFFFAAHLLALVSGHAPDGLSAPYQYALLAEGLLVAITGLLVLGKVLNRFFDTTTRNITLILVVFGTNYLQLTTFDGTLLSHNFLFLLYATLLWLTIRWHEKPKLPLAMVMGVVVGLITLVRPSEMMNVLIPLLWGATSYMGILRKLALLKTHHWHVRLFILMGLLTVLPQLLYWKAATGHLFYFSYTNAGEGFEFGHPFITDFLFSFRKGWLLYTPLMGLALAGIIALYHKNKPLVLPISVFLAIHLYVAASWTCWWYAGGSFSSRSMVPVYAILAIPMGYLLEEIRGRSSAIRAVAIATIVFFVGLNLFQTWQFRVGIIDKERMTRAYYLATFGKTSVPAGADQWLLVKRADNGVELFSDTSLYQSRRLYTNTFDDQPTDSTQCTTGGFLLTADHPFSPGPDLTYRMITQSDHAWLKVSADITIPESDTGALPVLVITFHHNGKPYKYTTARPTRKENPSATHYSYNADYLTPEVRSVTDNFKAYLWLRGQGKACVDNFTVTAYERKPSPNYPTD